MYVQFEFPWGSHDLETFTTLGSDSVQKICQQTLVNADESSFKVCAPIDNTISCTCMHVPWKECCILHFPSLKVARVEGKKAFPFVISLAADVDGGNNRVLAVSLCCTLNPLTAYVHVYNLIHTPQLCWHISVMPTQKLRGQWWITNKVQ